MALSFFPGFISRDIKNNNSTQGFNSLGISVGITVGMFSEFQNPYEDIEFHSRSIGQTKPWHNQTARFSNVTDMVRYVCVEMDAGVQGNFAQWNYIPICEFPYAPKGWIDDGVPGNSDVKFGDCSILLSDAMPSYNQECFNLAIIAIIPLLFSTFFLKLSNDKKLKKDRAKHFWMPKNPNLNVSKLSTGRGICLSFLRSSRTK